MESHEVNILNNTIKYFKIGKGKPIIFLHSFEGILLTHPIRELSKSYEIYMPVIPGYADTPAIKEINSIEKLSDLFIEFIQKITDQKVDLIGYSLGGYLALWISAKKPDIIDQLVLMSPLGLNVNNQKIHLEKENFDKLIYKYPESFNQLAGDKNYVDHNKIDIYEYDKLDKKLLDKLSEIENLTLILLANDDLIVPSISAQMIKEKIQHSYLIYI